MNYMISTFNLTGSHTSDSLFKMYFVPQNRIQENRHWKTNKSIMKRFQLEGQSLQIRAETRQIKLVLGPQNRLWEAKH